MCEKAKCFLHNYYYCLSSKETINVWHVDTYVQKNGFWTCGYNYKLGILASTCEKEEVIDNKYNSVKTQGNISKRWGEELKAMQS